MTYKTITHWFAIAIAGLAGFALTPAGQALVTQYPKLSILFGAIGAIGVLYHNPKASAVLLLFLALCSPGFAQTAPAPQPVQLLTISGTATGFQGASGTQAATIAAAGLQVTSTISVVYEHVAIPAPNWRFELGIVNYSNTADKFVGQAIAKKVVFDLSNIVITVGAGGGKFLSPGGNHYAETAHVSITRPLAAHMGWQVFSYQYIHSPVSGFINKGYSTASTGPIFYF